MRNKSTNKNKAANKDKRKRKCKGATEERPLLAMNNYTKVALL